MIIKRLVGFLLIMLACTSLALTVYGALQVWKMRQPITQSINLALATAAQTLNTSAQALIVVDGALTTTSNSISAARTSLISMAETIHGSNEMVGSVAALTGESLPAVLSSTQASLATTQGSAIVIENTVSLVSKIPFFPGGPYQPEVPLNVALGQVSADLEALRLPLEDLTTELQTSQADLDKLETDVALLAVNIHQVKTDLNSASLVVGQYQEQVTRTGERLSALQTKVPIWVNTAAWALTFIAFWLGVAQAGVLFQGIKWLLPELFERRSITPQQPSPEPPAQPKAAE